MVNGKFDLCIGTSDRIMKRQIIAMLSSSGFYTVGGGESIPELLRTLRSVQPWLVLVDVDLPPGNVEQLASIIEDDALAAALYLGSPGRRLERYVSLPWPVDRPVLAAVAEALCLEFAHKKELRREIGSLNLKLAGRRDVEKAKGLLMQKYQINEEEAFRLLRKQSMNQQVSLAEAARRTIQNP